MFTLFIFAFIIGLIARARVLHVTNAVLIGTCVGVVLSATLFRYDVIGDIDDVALTTFTCMGLAGLAAIFFSRKA